MMSLESNALSFAPVVDIVPGPEQATEGEHGPAVALVPPGWQPAPHEHANDDGGASERQYAEQCSLLLRSARRRVSSLRQLTRLRRINEDLQNCFHQLERILPPDAAGMTIAFADEPGSPDAKLTLGWSSNGLKQILPVSSNGVSAFELRLSDIRAGEGATLHVHLVSREDHLVVDRWTVPLAEVNAGWTMFCLTRPMVGPTSTLEIRIDVECEADVHLALSLGAFPTLTRFQAHNPVTDVPAGPRGLAMRVWCGDAHSAFGRHGNAQVADARAVGAGGVTDAPLSPTLIAAVEHYATEPARSDFKAVTWVPYRVAVACHPPATDITLAAVPLPQTLGIRSIIMDVEVGNPKSRTVEFAAVLASDPERARALFETPAIVGEGEACAAWTSADFGRSSQLRLDLNRPLGADQKLYLATRMLVPGNKDYAWARFRRFTLRALP